MQILIDGYFNQKALEQNPEVNFNRPFQQCSLSVMDTIADPGISFDEKGVCNYFFEYKEAEKKYVRKGEEGRIKLQEDIARIKEGGRGKKYDCIIGLSGGVDSTFLCLLAKESGLRPLIVHFDNGWNSELAVNNIEAVVNGLNFDLYTYVVDWKEFRELQLSYMKASVVDIEALTDQAFMAVLYEQARKWNIKYVLAGMNIVTEQVLPKYWIYRKSDIINIRDIQSGYGVTKPGDLKSYPFLSYHTKRYCERVLKMEVIAPLNYIEYNYDVVKSRISAELNWREYGGKHYESVWTRFYQGYILPRKFNIDKRKAHLSNLIFSGQISKEQAVKELAKPMYDLKLLNDDLEFVLKKLELTSEAFEKLMMLPRVEHNSFKVQRGLRERFPILNLFFKS
ncbi:MAG: N-acetyl sugar amidotransferase [Chitinophagaceae bacterium]|nr:N-acetyl sugar amidotransferase [Chitinophagaceae bacterium]MCW5926331.1 N-acetyl sugar amidotransferase [Chitinophagaceae bacterium]